MKHSTYRAVKMTSAFRILVRHISLSFVCKEKIGIVGVPFDKGQPLFGVSLGPDAIRAGGLNDRISHVCKLIDL